MDSSMEYSCFSSSDPRAVNATLLYDDSTPEGNLWLRRRQDIPLPHCYTISPPPDGRCLVCLEQRVYAVCRNLMDHVKMVLEAVGKDVEISKSECPKPPSDESPELPSDDTWKWWLILIPILVIIALLVSYIWKKYRKTSQCLTRGKKEKAIERVLEEEGEAAHLERERDAEAAM